MATHSGVEVIVRRNEFAAVAARVDPAAQRRMRMVREEIADLARRFAAVRTGFMREHIIVTRTGVQSLATYSVHQEYGTWKMRAHPFMRPAVARALPYLYRVFEGFESEITSGFAGSLTTGWERI